MWQELLVDLLAVALDAAAEGGGVDVDVDGRTAEPEVYVFDEGFVVFEGEVVDIVGAADLGAAGVGGVA